jgi:exodeoxyribonuclease-3
MRLDYVLVAEPLAADLRQAGMIRDYRKGTKPSDHAPVVVEL